MSEQVYAVKLSDESLRRASASGGAFVAFAESVLADGGVVCGASWDKQDWSVRHRRVTQREDLASLKGSKYAPSDFVGIIPQIAEDLMMKRQVLFSGTPCQIAAIRKKFENEESLLTVEIFCHGIPDDKVWDFYKDTLTGGVVAIDFKNKRRGWNNPTLVIRYADGQEREEALYANPYVRAYMSGLAMRKGCFSCPFKSGKSGADISIGDYWGIELSHPEFADENGVSVVVVHTEEGLKALKNIADRITAIESSVEKFLPRNPNYARSHKEPDNRDLFMRRFQKEPMDALVTRCLEGPWIVRISHCVLNKIRRVLCA